MWLFAARVDWATLLRRSFEVDVLACARCGGRLRVLGEVSDPAFVQLVLEALGQPGTHGRRRGHATQRVCSATARPASEGGEDRARTVRVDLGYRAAF